MTAKLIGPLGLFGRFLRCLGESLEAADALIPQDGPDVGAALKLLRQGPEHKAPQLENRQKNNQNQNPPAQKKAGGNVL